MQYAKTTLDGINIVNTVLQKLNILDLFEAPDIRIEWNTEYNVQFILEFDEKKRQTKNSKLEKDPSVLSILFSIHQGGIEVHLSVFPEMFQWSVEEIEKDKAKIENDILMILANRIKIEYHGSKYRGYRKVSFYDDNGDCAYSGHIRLGFGHPIKTNWNYKVEEYMPFFRTT